MMVKRILYILMGLSVFISCATKDPFRIVGEKKIFERKSTERIKEIKVSRDLNNWVIHSARTLKRHIEGEGYILEDKEYVVHNGLESNLFDHIILTGFSPNSKKIAYIAGAEGKWSIFVNGKEIKRYDALIPPPLFGRGRFTAISSLLFSPDSKKLAYVVSDRGKSFIVLNNKENKKYDAILSHVFSPDSKKLAYAAKEEGKWVVCLDNTEGKRYDNISPPAFSPDGSKLAYIAQEGGQSFVVVNGEEGNRYDKIVALPVFSPDNRKLAFFAVNNKNIFVVVNNKEFLVDKGTPGSKLILFSNSLSFSPDSNELAYRAEYYGLKQEGHLFVISDKRSVRHRNAYDFSFSPDNSRLAYVAKEGNNFYVVVNGRGGKRYADITSHLIFSQDNNKLSYVAHEDGNSFVVTNSQESKKYDEITSSPRFCSNSKKILFTAKKDGKMFVVVNDEEKKKYDAIIDAPQFSPDCRKIGYYAREGDMYFRVIERVY